MTIARENREGTLHHNIHDGSLDEQNRRHQLICKAVNAANQPFLSEDEYLDALEPLRKERKVSGHEANQIRDSIALIRRRRAWRGHAM